MEGNYWKLPAKSGSVQSVLHIVDCRENGRREKGIEYHRLVEMGLNFHQRLSCISLFSHFPIFFLLLYFLSSLKESCRDTYENYLQLKRNTRPITNEMTG